MERFRIVGVSVTKDRETKHISKTTNKRTFAVIWFDEMVEEFADDVRYMITLDEWVEDRYKTIYSMTFERR